ncbi:DUF747-domain-containing protein [Choiromyces venosus 120613-1]|uniref:DUF747-domain-containing protein n=1 Tax=Choiromyces venosus 120613-1 TaxID=1336337 RepID=A0A3N4JEU3_9PEZI|nr:DUF747-domain-containing protein [Choiromyces venosus 120613-1]
MTSDTAPEIQHHEGLHSTLTVAAAPHLQSVHDFQPLDGALRDKASKNGTSGEPQESLKEHRKVEENDTGQNGSVESTNGNRDSGSRSIGPIAPLQQLSSTASSEDSWASETDESRQPPTSELTKSGGKLPAIGTPITEADKVLKLSPTRLGELLSDNPGAAALLRPASPVFTRLPISPEPSGALRSRHRSTTNPFNTSPMTSKVSLAVRPHLTHQERTLSAPSGMKRSRSSPRALQLNTQNSNNRPPQQQRGRTTEKPGVTISPQKTSGRSSSAARFGSDGSNDPASAKSANSSAHTNRENGAVSSTHSHPPTTTHLLKSATPTPESFPPLPLQTYLSLALSSPTSSSPSPSMNFPSPPQAGLHQQTQTYGPPQHHPDDTAEIAIERIMNVLLLPPKLEGALWFGALACLDSWLYMFTILPLRFMRALGLLCAFWWGSLMGYCTRSRKDVKDHKPRSRSSSNVTRADVNKWEKSKGEKTPLSARRKAKRVSDLLPSHKADILRGLVVFCTCWILMRFDASRMYHSIRGQNGVKLYVIYNMLEISDKLCSALGQDIFECLFSKETLERGLDGRSKVLRPFGFFLLGLAYNTAHSTALFYQVITLNVAVNSYSNALVTLLLSVQFVEIKSTVFKKFEKENLFQLTCADIVERFQLWLMLIIIASRNLVETGVWSLAGPDTSSISGAGVMPKSFTLFPKWTGQVMGPFLLVLGSEMLVDWLKHAYITKFNNTRPAVYERFLDVLSKDYYSHAFADQNLTKRLGLPVIPLACLFIRASLQTYQMFLATQVPLPMPSTTTSLSESHTSRTTTEALTNIDVLLRRALGHYPTSLPSSLPDNLVATAMLLIFFIGFFLVFLAIKIVLGICLLSFARRRYKGMKDRERMNFLTGARRVGGFGAIEVNEDQKKWIYADDPEGERLARERDSRPIPPGPGLETVRRYSMAAKRIW